MCPLCKETYYLEQLKSAEVRVAPSMEKKNIVKFHLLKRNPVDKSVSLAYLKKGQDEGEFQKVKSMDKECFENLNKVEINSILCEKDEFSSVDNNENLRNSTNFAMNFLMKKVEKTFDDLDRMEKHFNSTKLRKDKSDPTEEEILKFKKKKKRKKKQDENNDVKGRKKSSFEIRDRQIVYDFENYYQEVGGSQSFLHPINLKYILLQENYPPPIIEVKNII